MYGNQVKFHGNWFKDIRAPAYINLLFPLLGWTILQALSCYIVITENM